MTDIHFREDSSTPFTTFQIHDDRFEELTGMIMNLLITHGRVEQEDLRELFNDVYSICKTKRECLFAGWYLCVILQQGISKL